MEGAQTGVEEKGMLGKYGLNEERGGREAQTSDGMAEPSPQVQTQTLFYAQTSNVYNKKG